MKGRKAKPLAVKIAEGSRVRNDRLNRQAPVPPVGEVVPPHPLNDSEAVIWRLTLKSAAPGQIKPLDAALLWRYCTSLALLLEAHQEREAWRMTTKTAEVGESGLLKMGANKVLGAHPILGVIDKLMQQVAQQESKLGLTPVDREHIKTDAQKEIFPNDPWAQFEAPSETPQ